MTGIVALRVSGENWGDVRPIDVSAVVHSAASAFASAIGSQESINICLMHTMGANDPPMAFCGRNQFGEVVVRVNIKGERLWARLAFQFAHEFCHVLAGPTGIIDRFTWLEESLCETASLFALRLMAITWSVDPPYPNWHDYSLALAAYANDRMTDPASCLPPDTHFRDWLAEHAILFENDPYRREDNVIVAKELLPIFESNHFAWRSLRFLHLGERSNSVSLTDFLTGWRDACPAESRNSVESIAAELGVTFSC